MPGFPRAVVSMVWSRGGSGGRVAGHLPQRSQVSVPLCPAEDMEEDCRGLPGAGDLGDTERETDRGSEKDRDIIFSVLQHNS